MPHTIITPQMRASLLRRTRDEFEDENRISNCLINYNIEYIGDLVSKTDAELLRIPNFGKLSLSTVKETLHHLDLRLGMDIPNWPQAFFDAAHKPLYNTPVPQEETAMLQLLKSPEADLGGMQISLAIALYYAGPMGLSIAEAGEAYLAGLINDASVNEVRNEVIKETSNVKDYMAAEEYAVLVEKILTDRVGDRKPEAGMQVCMDAFSLIANVVTADEASLFECFTKSPVGGTKSETRLVLALKPQ